MYQNDLFVDLMHYDQNGKPQVRHLPLRKKFSREETLVRETFAEFKFAVLG